MNFAGYSRGSLLLIGKTKVENIYLYFLQIKTKTGLCIVVHACNLSTEEAEAGGSYISSQELIAGDGIGCRSCTRSLLEDGLYVS